MERDDNLNFFQAGHYGIREWEQEYRAEKRRAHRRVAASPQARILRGYIAYKTFTEEPDRQSPRHLDDLDMLLIAAVNAATVQQALEWIDKIGSHIGVVVQRRELKLLRERGEKVLAEYPDLRKPEPGLPRGIRLASDPEPEEEPDYSETADIDLDSIDFDDSAPPRAGR
ncbi:hypothetical protein [Fodinicurvata sediminis]|uniref:hypothetical protein n=1 Tax=Fodinicurvata sediminis TaxID=1121832 RepID=UPI0003B710F5|nr:hypothetical protein [Fodinicurvata sediminis]